MTATSDQRPATAGLPFSVAIHGADTLLPAQLAAVAAIEASCFDHPWGPSGLGATLASSGAKMALLVAEPAQAVAAYCLYQRILDEIEIFQLATAPSQQRQGLGRRLLDAVLARAAGEGCQAAFLEVRRSNLAACALYTGAGFAAAGVRRSYYPVIAAGGSVTGREDALLLRCALQSAAKTQ